MRQDILHGIVTDSDIGAVSRAMLDPMRAVEELRLEVMRVTGAPDCVLLCNCTQALRVALLSFVGLPKYECAPVVVPDLTFVATAHAVRAAGHLERLVDVDPDTLHMTAPGTAGWPDSAAAVVPVELLGRPISSDLVGAIHDFGAPIIVDAAQSLGATRWRDEYTAMCVSFAANKIVHGHQGGAILCRPDDADRVRRYVRHGRAPNATGYHHESPGENLGINPLGAALALSQLRRIGDVMARRKAQREAYGSRVCRYDGSTNNWVHIGPRQTNAGRACCDLWEPMHMQPHLNDGRSFPAAEAAFDDLVALPSSDDVTPEQIEETNR